MKLKIISDGTVTGTKLINQDTGETVSLVQKIVWEADANSAFAKATIELINVPVEFVVDDAEIKERISNGNDL